MTDDDMPIPEHVEYHGPPLVSRPPPTKPFGYGRSPAGTYVDPHYEASLQWWSDVWDLANGYREENTGVRRLALQTGMYQAVLPHRDHHAMITCNCSTKEVEVHGIVVDQSDGEKTGRGSSATGAISERKPAMWKWGQRS
jgi:hypothetical protein